MKISKKNSYIITDLAEKWVTELSKNTIAFGFGSKVSKKKQKEKFLILLSDPNFIKEVYKIREVFGIPKQGFNNDEKTLEWAKDLYSKDNRVKSFKNIIRNLYPNKIGARWYPAIEYFILFNRSDANHLFPNQVNFGIRNDNGEFILELEIYKDTSLENIEKIWPIIKKNREIVGKINKMKIGNIKDKNPEDVIYTIHDNRLIKIKGWRPKRFGSYKIFLQYKKAFDLKQQGKKYKEIAKELGLYESDWPKIGTYIKRFKKAIKENILY